MRGESRRQQRRQHRARGPALRPRMQRTQPPRRPVADAAAAVDPLLAVQPLRGARRVRRPQLLPERPGHRAAPAFGRRVQQGVQRDCAAVQARRGLQSRRRATQPVRAVARRARRVMGCAHRGDRLRVHAGVAAAHRPRVAWRLRGRGAGQARTLGRTGGGPAGRRDPGVRPLLAEAPVPEAAGGADFGDRLRPRAVPAPAPAGGVLRTPAGRRPDGSGLVHRSHREEPDGGVPGAPHRHGDERGAGRRHARLRRSPYAGGALARRAARLAGPLPGCGAGGSQPGDAP